MPSIYSFLSILTLLTLVETIYPLPFNFIIPFKMYAMQNNLNKVGNFSYLALLY